MNTTNRAATARRHRITVPTSRVNPIEVPRDAIEVVQILADDIARVLLVGRSQSEALDMFDAVVHAAREFKEFDRIVHSVVRVNGADRLRMMNGSTLKIASAAAPRGLDSHHYDLVLLAPNVVLDEILARNLSAAVAPARGGAGVIAWLPAVA